MRRWLRKWLGITEPWEYLDKFALCRALGQDSSFFPHTCAFLVGDPPPKSWVRKYRWGGEVVEAMRFEPDWSSLSALGRFLPKGHTIDCRGALPIALVPTSEGDTLASTEGAGCWVVKKADGFHVVPAKQFINQAEEVL